MSAPSSGRSSQRLEVSSWHHIPGILVVRSVQNATLYSTAYIICGNLLFPCLGWFWGLGRSWAMQLMWRINIALRAHAEWWRRIRACGRSMRTHGTFRIHYKRSTAIRLAWRASGPYFRVSGVSKEVRKIPPPYAGPFLSPQLYSPPLLGFGKLTI